MRTHEGAQRGGPVAAHDAAHLVGGMGRAALTALAALAVGALVIGIGAALSICWAIHPLLTVAVAVVVLWLASRLASLALRGTSRP